MINEKKVAAIVQARQGSSRLPGKALIDICGKPALQRVIERLRAAKLLDDIIVATTKNEADDAIAELCERLNCSYFRGSENDVLDRVLKAAKTFCVDVICEITADCPLIDWNHVDHLITMHMNGEYDLTSNIIDRSFPRGYDIRIFDFETLERANIDADNYVDRQHVSTVMYLNTKTKDNYDCQNWIAPPEQNKPNLDITLDTPEDLELIRWIYGFEAQGYNLELNCAQVISLIDTYPMIYTKVNEVVRKDYFREMQEYYETANRPEKEELKGSDENEKVECTDSGGRGTGKRGRPARKRKRA